MRTWLNRSTFVAVSLILFAILSGIIILFFVYRNNSEWATRGQIGDSLNVLTSLFSFCTFVGLIITISVQRRELIEQINSNQKALEATFSSLAIQEGQATLDAAIRLQSFYAERLNFLRNQKAEGPTKAEILIDMKEASSRLDQLAVICDQAFRKITGDIACTEMY